MADAMIPMFKVNIPADVDGPLLETLHSGYITEGPKVKEFEGAFGSLIGNSRVLAVSSGTMALTIALRLAGVKAGDRVVTTPMTCTATNLPILSLGAVPVWADVNPATGLIDPDSVREKVQANGLTKAIMAVDWGGMPCDLDALKAIGKQHGVPVIEDAAHALGAEYKGHNVGQVADYTCFSLQAIKHVTTVDGGVLAVSGDASYRRGRKMRWFGIDREAAVSGDSRIDVDITEWGYKGHMNDVAAAIGLVQLQEHNIGPVLKAQRNHAEYFHSELSGYYLKPIEPEGKRSAYWLYTILFRAPEERGGFRKFMASRGIQVSQVHKRNDQYTVFKDFSGFALPGLDYFSSRMMCIPVHWALSRNDLSQIANACNEWARL